MLKTTMNMLTAMLLVGASAMPLQAAGSLQSMSNAGDRYADPPKTWMLAHFSEWSHYHMCTPSPCKGLKYRHKKGHGWG